MHLLEFFNTLKCLGLPNHEMKLKGGVPIMLMRNINQSLGFCNVMRLRILNLAKHIVKAKVILRDTIHEIISFLKCY